MNGTPADLTLLILRLIQGAPKPPMKEWFFFPGFVAATSEEAREQLVAAPKPLVVAPLLEAGCVGVWAIGDLAAAARASAERELSNRNEYFAAKLLGMWPDGVDAVRLQEGEADMRLDLAAFQEWERDYYVAVGHGLERERDPRVARLTVRPPGGSRRPIGLPAEYRDLSTAS